MFSCRVQHFAAGCSKTCLNHWLFTGSPHFSSIFGPVNPADYPPGAPRLQLLLVQPTALPKGDELYLGLARLPRSRTKVRNTYSMFIIYNIYLLYLYVFIYIYIVVYESPGMGFTGSVLDQKLFRLHKFLVAQGGPRPYLTVTQDFYMRTCYWRDAFTAQKRTTSQHAIGITCNIL